MLFPSTLFISTSAPDLIPYLQELGHLGIENNPDILVINDYKIENIRQIKTFLSRHPYSHLSKIVIIPRVELLNIESQNALLKNLEEPADNNYFILSTSVPNSLLPTIISRCHLIRLAPTSPSATISPLIFSESVDQSLSTSQSLPRDKASALDYVQHQISAYQQLLVNNPNSTNQSIINKLIKCSQMLNANVDPTACFDFLLLS